MQQSKNLMLICILLLILSCDKRENPNERNYLFFKNDKIENIIDSMLSFEKMVKTLPFQKFKLVNAIGFDFYDGIFKVNDIEIASLDFMNLRENKYFTKFTDNEIKDFINLYIYLYKNGVKPGMYCLGNNHMSFDYKDYYDMYETHNYDGELNRNLKIIEAQNIENYLGPHFKVIDHYKNLYLYTNKDSRIYGDSIEYRNILK